MSDFSENTTEVSLLKKSSINQYNNVDFSFTSFHLTSPSRPNCMLCLPLKFTPAAFYTPIYLVFFKAI